LFDVIEHVRDDIAFVRSIRDLLAPGGKLYVTAPAYSFLWSDQDDLAGHFRRYTLQSLAATLQAAGLEVSFSTYFFRLLPVAIFLARALPYRLRFAKRTIDLEAVKREHLVSNEILSRALSRLLASEVDKIRRQRPMGLGGSCLVVATRS
jgi:SAM-dependent methyltransferase